MKAGGFAAMFLWATVASGMAAAPTTKRLVIIDQDALGPGGSNMQAIMMLLQAPNVELLGITITSGDGWRDEEVASTLRLLEVAQRPHVPVVPGAVLPLLNSAARTKVWESLYGNLYYKGRVDREMARSGSGAPHPSSDGSFSSAAVAGGIAADQGIEPKRR